MKLQLYSVHLNAAVIIIMAFLVKKNQVPIKDETLLKEKSISGEKDFFFLR